MTKEQELTCFNYSILQSEILTKQGNYKDAEIHLENAKRSLNELQRMKNTEVANKEINLLLEQIKGDQDLKKMLRGHVYRE